MSADGGQQEEKSGGSGRGEANDDSGGAGRAPRGKEAAGTRVVATPATAAGKKMSSHSSRALDRPRPADDVSRRQGTRVGATTETAAVGKMSSHSSRASDGSRPSDDTSRRPKVPASMDLIIKNRDRAEIIRMVGTRYSTLLQKKGSQRSSRPPEQAFFTSGSGERIGAR